MTPITVLVVEDHQITVDGIMANLPAYDDIAIVGSATDATSSLKLARELNPDVILLDLHIPGSSGPKSLVESFCTIGKPKVIVLSAENRIAFVEVAIGAGASGYLLKSEPPAGIVAAIRRVMSGESLAISSALSLTKTKLTVAEKQLLKLLARGMKYEDIAALRSTSRSTVRNQTNMLLIRLSLETREQLIAWAVENGFGGVEVT